MATLRNSFLDPLDLEHTRCVAVHILHGATADFLVQAQATSTLSSQPSLEADLDGSAVVTVHQMLSIHIASGFHTSGHVHESAEGHSQARSVERVAASAEAVQASSSLIHVRQPLLPVGSLALAGDCVSPAHLVHGCQRHLGLGAVHTGHGSLGVELAFEARVLQTSVETQDLAQHSGDASVVFVGTVCDLRLHQGSTHLLATDPSGQVTAAHSLSALESALLCHTNDATLQEGHLLVAASRAGGVGVSTASSTKLGLSQGASQSSDAALALELERVHNEHSARASSASQTASVATTARSLGFT
jgi:hypothetical protein